MMIRHRLLIIFIGLLMGGCKAISMDDYQHGDAITISGRLTMIGNVPFQQWALYMPKHNQTIPLIMGSLVPPETISEVTITGHIDIQKKPLAYSNQPIYEWRIAVGRIRPN